MISLSIYILQSMALGICGVIVWKLMSMTQERRKFWKRSLFFIWFLVPLECVLVSNVTLLVAILCFYHSFTYETTTDFVLRDCVDVISSHFRELSQKAAVIYCTERFQTKDCEYPLVHAGFALLSLAIFLFLGYQLFIQNRSAIIVRYIKWRFSTETSKLRTSELQDILGQSRDGVQMEKIISSYLED